MMASQTARTVGFIGLDELSLEMAASLIRSDYIVKAFESSGALMEKFFKIGGFGCANIAEAGKDVAVVIILVNHDNAKELVVGDLGIFDVFHEDMLLLLRTAALPGYLDKMEKYLTGAGRRDSLVDMYVFKGNDKISIASSGMPDALARTKTILSAMCENLFTLEGEIGAASKLEMVVKLLEGIHLVASAEAISLGVQAGIHPWILYDIICNAAGCSWVFRTHLPQVLSGDHTKNLFLRSKVQDLGPVLDALSSVTFPAPLFAVAHQQLIAGFSCGQGSSVDIPVVKIWEEIYGAAIRRMANTEVYNPQDLGNQNFDNSTDIKRIGFIGLGAMGLGMATHLLRQNFIVYGYDVNEQVLSQFANVGGLIGQSPADVSEHVDVLVVMVTNEAQVESVLYGHHGVLPALSFGASIIISSTVSPKYIQHLEVRLQGEGKDLKVVDAPVSGGVKRAATGTLTIMASATSEALKSAGPVLSALSERFYVIKGSCGAASTVKMVNQLLAGVHIASAAEAMAFGAKMGLNTRTLFDVIRNSTATSWMFENRVPHMLANDYSPYSALNIFVKDLGIVTRESACRCVPLYLSSIAHQLFIAGAAAGWGRLDDSAVVKVYENLTSVHIQGMLPILSKRTVLGSLPPEWPQDPIRDIREIRERYSKILVVLDDDPTGTQTVHDIEVLTEWTIESLIAQFKKKPACFFILTNSRSMNPEKASMLIKDICKNLNDAATSCGHIEFTVVLRGDSTLRGHFPEEAYAAVSILGEMDAWVICPFFLQGGRFTIDDIHYVADADCLIPAGETEFAKDAAFGYRCSNLCKWIEEKSKGRITASNVGSVPIHLLRTGGPVAVCELLCGLPKGSMCVVNAVSDRDMAVFAAGMIQAELKGKHFLCRTGASFVSASIGIEPKGPILPRDLRVTNVRNGGLIVVGSYVPKTTKQTEVLKQHHGRELRIIEVFVDKVAVRSLEEREAEIKRATELADTSLSTHRDAVIMTSRELIKGNTPIESLDINFRVSSALVEIVTQITTRPRYILAKGGITSSDIATKALGVKCAKIMGQVLPGVPLWLLGPESKYPELPYIVFPGNVGDDTTLATVVERWACPLMKEILLHAEEAGYAVGAFNVYNLEGVEAVIAAAEVERSPAILQIHPSALKHGGTTLVACCITAADRASVPVAVHFDHGVLRDELTNALELPFDSIMVDGSHLPFEENVSYTKCMADLAHSKGVFVEAELGRLSGIEDGLTVEDYKARLTDVIQAQQFISETGIDALAVCIGNVHGNYPTSGPHLNLDILQHLHALASKAGVFLVLHGASGLPVDLIKGCIERGVRKFNVNTEVRQAYLKSLGSSHTDLIDLMRLAKEAMRAVVAEKMRLFGSAGKA